MGKTTVVINDKLLQAAIEVIGAKSKKEAFYEISTDAILWGVASQLAFKLHRKGLTIPYTDILIACAALESKAVLLHADAHFDLLVKHTELKVEGFLSLVQEDYQQRN